MIVRKIHHTKKHTRDTHMHTYSPSQLHELASGPEAARLSDGAKTRLGWIMTFAENGCSVHETCAAFGISRSTFHRWLERFDPTDLSTLEEKSHEPLNPRQSDVSADAITLIRAYRQTNPHMGKEKIRVLLASEHGITMSSSTVGRVIERECLYFATTPLHWKKRTSRSVPAAHGENDTATVVATRTIPLQTHTKKTQPAWKRALITSSILINIAIITLFLMTASWEFNDMAAQVSSQQPERTTTVSNLDRP